MRLADIASGQPLPVAGKSFAGQPYHGEWPAGTCIRIMTGAPVPEGCEAVVMQEQTEQTDAGVRFTAEVRSGQNIRRRGEDISAGAVVFPAGTRLTTAELPVIASLGIAEVPVIRKVRVALFSTGDELQLPGPAAGRRPNLRYQPSRRTPDVRTAGMRGNQLRDYPRRSPCPARRIY